MEEIIGIVKSLGGTALAVVLIVGFYLLAQRVLLSKLDSSSKYVPLRRIILFTIAFIGLLIIIMVLPMGHELRGQIIGFLGVIISAGLVLSSTTFLGNALSALMMRFVNSFQVGDFIETAQLFGRVTKRGIFHTEIQTEDRDLVTIPNLHLATNPVKVLRNSGTIIKASVSLGYDVQRGRIEELLLKAGEKTGLKEPFVFITALNDFSVSYVLHGFLEDCSGLLTTRSQLRKNMLDQLHEDGIEIVSPTFMNQRQIGDQKFIPKKDHRKKKEPENVEGLLFDKAELAKELEVMQSDLAALNEHIDAMEKQVKKEGETPESIKELASLNAKRDRLTEKLKVDTDKLNKE